MMVSRLIHFESICQPRASVNITQKRIAAMMTAAQNRQTAATITPFLLKKTI